MTGLLCCPNAFLYAAGMNGDAVPRAVTSVLVEAGSDSVTVTWGLGPPTPVASFGYFGYEVYYYDPSGSGGKRFGVRFGVTTTAWVFDNASSTQANYDSHSVTSSADSIVAHYRDASLGLREVGFISAYAHVNGVDTQTELPVTLLR